MTSSVASSSWLWPSISLALLLTNVITIAYVARRRRQTKTTRTTQPLNDRSDCRPTNSIHPQLAQEEVEDEEDISTTKDEPTHANAIVDDDDEHSSTTTVANSPLSSPNHCETFQSSYELTDLTPIRRVKRLVHVQDTNQYLHGITKPIISTQELATNTASKQTKQSSSSSPNPPPTLADLPPNGSWSGCSVITSVPDVSETGLSLVKWRPWFRHVCVSIMQRIDSDQVAIFYQTDIRAESEWVSKAFLVMQAAEKVGLTLVWHKVVLVNSVNTIRGSTASFVNLLCFSRNHRENTNQLSPDVIAHRGTMLWKRAMGLRACEFACHYIRTHVPSATTIVDPFCGSGSTLSMANRFGLHSIGVDHCRKRCLLASKLDVRDLADFGGADSAEVLEFNEKKKAAAIQRKNERAASGRSQKEQHAWEKEQKRLAKLSQQRVPSSSPGPEPSDQLSC